MTVKSKQRFAWTYNHAAGTVKVTDTITGDQRQYQVADYPERTQQGYTVYGLGKKFQDANSGVSGDGKLASFDATHEQLLAGKWKADKTGGSRFLPPIIEVIMEFKGWSLHKAQKSYRALDAEARQALKDGQAKRIAEIIEARLAEGVSSLDDMI